MEIKGDMRVDARGVSDLMAKEVKAQVLGQAMQVLTNPQFAPWVKAGDVLREYLRNLGLPDKLLLTEEEHQQQAMESAQSPQAQLEQQGQAAEVAKTQAEAQRQAAEAEATKAQMEMDAFQLGRQIQQGPMPPQEQGQPQEQRPPQKQGLGLQWGEAR